MRTGTPQGGILSPLLANLALSDLDDHFAELWQQTSATRVDRARRHRHGRPTYRLVRYADDFVVMVNGTREHAEALHAPVAAILAGVGLTLAPDITGIAHIDDGFDLLGFRIQRQAKQGDGKQFVYTYPSKKSLCGEPDAVKVARPVRRAARGNGPAERLTPRPAPTLPGGAEPGTPSPARAHACRQHADATGPPTAGSNSMTAMAV